MVNSNIPIFDLDEPQSSARFMYWGKNIDGNLMHRYVRSADRWYLDPRIDKDVQVGNELYQRNRLDRGHLVRRLDPVWGEKKIARQAMEDTFHYTNAAPQHEGLNQITWNELEDYILDNADAHDLKISVFTGLVFSPRNRIYRDVELPKEFWKIVVMARQGAEGRLVPHTTAYLLSQTDLLGNIEFAFGAYRTWQVPVALTEERTRLDFFALRTYDPLDAGTREGWTPKPQPIDGWCDIVMSCQSGEIPVDTGFSALDQLRRLVQTEQRLVSLDYIAEFTQAPLDDLDKRIAMVLPAVVGIESIFASDRRFVRIRLPGLDPSKLKSSPFELVEPLRTALGALNVEPDLPTDFFPVPPLPEELARESADFLGCWVGNSLTPRLIRIGR